MKTHSSMFILIPFCLYMGTFVFRNTYRSLKNKNIISKMFFFRVLSIAVFYLFFKFICTDYD